MNTSILTISPVTEQDEYEYYCVASNGGADGSLYEDRSHDAMITVYGELIGVSLSEPHTSEKSVMDHATRIKTENPTLARVCN